MCKFVEVSNGDLYAIESLDDFASMIKAELGERASNMVYELIEDVEEYKEVEIAYLEMCDENKEIENRIDELKFENERLKAEIEKLKRNNVEVDIIDDEMYLPF